MELTKSERERIYQRHIKTLSKDECNARKLIFQQFAVRFNPSCETYCAVGVDDAVKAHLVELNPDDQSYLSSLNRWANHGGDCPVHPSRILVPEPQKRSGKKAEKITVGADSKPKIPRKKGESLRDLINAGRRI